MHINWKKEVLPHVVAVLVFVVLSFAYFSPVLNGGRLQQSDILQYEAMSKEAKTFYQDTGEDPLWSNSMFGGMPTFITYSGPTANHVHTLRNILTLGLPRPVDLLFLAMLGVYFLLSILKFNYGVNLLGSVAYGFSSYNLIIIGAGHVTKMFTMACMAPLLAGLILLYRGKYLLGAITTTLSMAILTFSKHYQIIYYTGILLLFFALYKLIEAIKEKQFRRFITATLIALGAALLGALPSLPEIALTQNYAQYTIRDSQSKLTLKDNNNSQIEKGGLNIDYAFQWSLGKLESFSILIPNVYGGAPGSDDFIEDSKVFQKVTEMGAQRQQAAGISNATLYWGPQPFTSPIYFGALIVFLFILSLFLIKSKHKWWILAATALSFLMAWGNNFEAFNHFLFDHLPMFNKFRTPSMIMIVPQLTFVLLGCWALNDVVTGKVDKKHMWKALKNTLYVSVGLIIFAWLAVSGGLGYTGEGDARLAAQLGEQAMSELRPAIKGDRAALFQKDAIRSLIFIALLFILLLGYLKEKIKLNYLLGAIGILILIDLMGVDKRYLNNDNFIPEEQLVNHYRPSKADQKILQDPSLGYRVLNLSGGISSVFNEAATSYFHHSVGGYSPAKLWRYQDLIDHQLMPNLQEIYSAFGDEKGDQEATFRMLSNFPVLNMLNTKYYIVNPGGDPVENPGALGSAWFVNQIDWVKNANEEMTGLSDLNPKKVALVDESFKSELENLVIDTPSHSQQTIKMTQYSLNQLEYESNNDQAGFGVFSQIYYPEGWKAFIDGEETPIVRVNYVLRGLSIPAGKHKITFTFHPERFFTGKTIAGISSYVLIVLLLLGLGLAFYRSHKEDQKLQDS